MNAVNGFYSENWKKEVGPQHEMHAPSEENHIFDVYVDLARELQYSIDFSSAVVHQNWCINDHA